MKKDGKKDKENETKQLQFFFFFKNKVNIKRVVAARSIRYAHIYVNIIYFVNGTTNRIFV